MRTILHLSDLHFGTERQEVMAPLIALSHALQPNVVVVSGDLTQRAEAAQFAAARDFLRQLPQPQIVVPGNHDVPLYNVFARFVHPLKNFRRFITDEPMPSYQDDVVKIVGINTARSLTFKDGRINEEQIGWLHAQFHDVPTHVVKVLVTHHPFELPDELRGQDKVVGRAALALPVLRAVGADLFLAGHLHRSEAGLTLLSDAAGGWQSLLVQAGTAISARHRGEANSFNVIRVAPAQATVQEYHWHAGTQQFECAEEERFQCTGHGWQLMQEK